jgi:hypothetical protein
LSGSGELTSSPLNLTIDARANANHPTAAAGTFHAVSGIPFDSFDITGPVSCLRVSGNTAWVGGQITSGGNSFAYFKIVANQPPASQEAIVAFVDDPGIHDCTFDVATIPWDVGNFALSTKGADPPHPETPTAQLP